MDTYFDHGDFYDQQSLQDCYDSFSDYDYDLYDRDTDCCISYYETDNDTDAYHLDSCYSNFVLCP